ncbi:hypothetical protein TRFO_24152 [Tritrichomonas foetus]|uniref:Uncharacterized protein n=1 Tax=Tritrichomonas foetus TaxID=1144522 RepID=A0A1J4K8V9_9EUKA|nr:hypothetical protein TRFO_24152 [Tritrichomonas foetus]|eukprot:OHT07651.1 hypothetical protein TRFO_24152 [Tritrichomonas foetus]
MFAAFTEDEVESIRSIVLLGQQQDDMLISNCSTRPILQTRSFIRRFKRQLLDSNVTIKEITNTANEQYVAIIAGVRVKKNSRQSHLPSASSVMNLASPFFQPTNSLPFKFRSKYARPESAQDTPSLPPPLPTRSRSVMEGLARPDPVSFHPQALKFNVIPPLQKLFPRACKNVSELKPGTLAALLSNNGGPAIICRVLGSRPINGVPHLLVSFFQADLTPAYVMPQHLVILPPYPRHSKLVLPDPLTVDTLLERMMQTSQVIIMENEIQPQSNDPHILQQHRDLMFRTLTCAAQLLFLDFAANFKVPKERLKLILDSIELMSPAKYMSSKIINNRCRDLIAQIISDLD